MLILAIETTGPNCSAALLDDDNEITELRSEDVLNHLQTLTPMIEQLMERCGKELSELDSIAVSVGPGSFTGIRIGVSTARALSQVTGVKAVAVPTLFAFGCGECEEAGAGDETWVACPIFDARRNQIYGGAYLECSEIIPGGPYMLDEFLDKLAPYDNIKFVGDGLKPYGEKIEKWAREKEKNIQCELKYQTAGNVAEFAADMMACPESFGDEINLDYNDLKPNYMRIPEAERKLKEKRATNKRKIQKR